MNEQFLNQKMNQEEAEAELRPSRCPHCGLDLDTHDGSGFCPGGTEEFGGRR